MEMLTIFNCIDIANEFCWDCCVYLFFLNSNKFWGSVFRQSRTVMDISKLVEVNDSKEFFGIFNHKVNELAATINLKLQLILQSAIFLAIHLQTKAKVTRISFDENIRNQSSQEPGKFYLWIWRISWCKWFFCKICFGCKLKWRRLVFCKSDPISI